MDEYDVNKYDMYEHYDLNDDYSYLLIDYFNIIITGILISWIILIPIVAVIMIIQSPLQTT